MTRTLILAALAVVTCVDAAWLPWTSLQQTRDLKEAPKNEFNISATDSKTICLRLSTSISIQVQYKINNEEKLWQLEVPHIDQKNVDGSCGQDTQDARLTLSWFPEVTTQSPTPTTASSADTTASSADTTASSADTTSSSADTTSVSSADTTTVSNNAIPTHLRLKRRSLLEAIASDSANANSLQFDFKQQDDSYFLGDITGVLNIVDAPDDFPADSEVLKLSVTGKKLFMAPKGVMSTCSGTTVIQAKFEDSDLAVNITMTDVEMLAYWDKSTLPTQVKSCHQSSAAPKLENMEAFVLGTVAALLANLALW